MRLVNIILRMVNLYGKGGFFVSYQLDAERIEEMMRSVYTLTGFRFVLFDAEFNKVLAYPAEDCSFCKLMKGCAKTRRKCRYADRRSFEVCNQTGGSVTYTCHAGLIEAVVPLQESGNNIGYLMFGQVTDNADKTPLLQAIDGWTACGIDKQKLADAVAEVSYKSPEEIHAAVQILEACTSYILYRELILPQSSKYIEAAKSYIEQHLGEMLDTDRLCDELGIGRTKLYEIFKTELGTGVSQYILRRRMHRAKKLLRTTELPIREIADMVGFADYNYFGRVFKKTYGRSAKSYRKA